MARKRILIDCDGVLADFVTNCVHLINKELNRNHDPSEVKEWDVFKALDVKEHEHILDNAINNDSFCMNLPVLPGAHEAIEKIEQEFGNVYIVTAPHKAKQWVFDRTHWLEHHFGIDKKRLVYTHAKHVVQGDALIDDSKRNLLWWKKHHENGIPIFWERQYNDVSSQPETVPNVVIAHSWKNVYDALQVLK